MGGSSPKAPELPPAPPPPPTPLDPEVKRARRENRQRAALAEGRNATILTSPQGLAGGDRTLKTLLGS